MPAFDVETAQNYQDLLDSYRSKALNNTLTQAEADDARLIVGSYYNYLQSAGITYGAVGYDVSQSNGFFGEFANDMLINALETAHPGGNPSAC